MVKQGNDDYQTARCPLSISISGTKFLCSEVIAPIRSEIDDISLYIINFEDLSNPQQSDSLASRFSKCKGGIDGGDGYWSVVKCRN